MFKNRFKDSLRVRVRDRDRAGIPVSSCIGYYRERYFLFPLMLCRALSKFSLVIYLQFSEKDKGRQ
jgi:hypothetical protein